MTWGLTFRLREYLRGSLWVVPLLGAITGVILGGLSVVIDQHVSVPAYWQYSPSTASTVLSAIVGSTAALIGFVVTVTVLVVQMATGTFSARYMRLWYRDRMLKATLSLLIGTLAYSFQLLRRVTSSFVPDLGVTVAGTLLLASLLIFMLYLDRVLHRMRPVAVASLVAEAGRTAFEAVVQAAASPDAPDLVHGRYDPGEEPAARVVIRSAGSVQAIDEAGLVRWARKHRLPARPAPHRRRLPARRGDGDRGLRQRSGTVGAHAQRDARARHGTDDRAGPGVRDPDHGRHRQPGALAGGQRPDHRGAGDRPSRRDPSPDRHDRPDGPVEASTHPVRRERGHAHARLGGLPRARRDRDPQLRRLGDPGEQAPARDARGAPRDGPARVPSGRRGRAGAARCERRFEMGATPPDLDRALAADRQGIGGPAERGGGG